MHFVTPKARLIAATELIAGPVNLGISPLSEYLHEIGAPDWHTDAPSDTEELIEVAGRMCYRSFAPGLNPNVTRVREGNESYVGNILAHHHGSVLEHAMVSFLMTNISRVFTHEVVRHRAGTAFSQESLRYVRLTDLSAYLPAAFSAEQTGKLFDALPPVERQEGDRAETRDEFASRTALALQMEMLGAFEEAEARMARITNMLRLDECKDFDLKKKFTSAMRRMAPDGLATAIMVSANHRAWRHMVAMRTNRHAEEELRLVFASVFEQLRERFPHIYQDGTVEIVDGLAEVTFANDKV